jgi:hypothetical protein
MSNSNTIDRRESPHTPISNVDDKKRRHKWANRLIYTALGILVLGLLDPINARVLCIGNMGITVLRMVCLAIAVALALTSVGIMIASRRLRIYWGILTFFVWMVVVMQPFYYLHLRSNVDSVECVWTGKTTFQKSIRS